MKRDELMARAKPVLFNTEMVTAIMEGRKTQTRRVIKPPRNYVGGGDYINGTGKKVRAAHLPNGGRVVAPYQVGDILYVRETWSPVHVQPKRYLYKAGCEEVDPFFVRWYPSIHMPKAAARLFLRVTDVRAERLQEITAKQCVKEGIPSESLADVGKAFTVGQFQDLWDSTVKKADRTVYGWDADPWVWVYEFERVVPT